MVASPPTQQAADQPNSPRRTSSQSSYNSTDGSQALSSRPTLSPRSSTGSLTSSAASTSSHVPHASHNGTSSHYSASSASSTTGTAQRRASTGFPSPSPLRGRGRQDSVSSNMSTATDATSLDDSSEELIVSDADTKAGSGQPPQAWAMHSPGARRISGSLSGSNPYAGFTAYSGAGLDPYGGHANAAGPVSVAPTGSLPISISTSVQPSSVRLSTTPLFPSPLAQASGPEEDHEQSRGEEGDGESDEDDEDGINSNLWADKSDQRRESTGSPLARESLALFGDIDMSPTLAMVGLPDPGSSSNSLGLEATTTPRPQVKMSHRRGPSSSQIGGGSPEHDQARTAKAPRIRSLGGRASSLASSPVTPEDMITGRRRSRGEGSPLSALGLETSKSVSSMSFGNFPAGSSSKSSGPATSSPMSSAPPSPSASSVSNISRRASINLVSPPRPFPISSSSLSRATGRSSLSAQIASSVPSPFPAAPPPIESIKLQKVPEAVRSAMEFRPSAAASIIDASSLPSAGSVGPHGTGDIRIPKTPSATRAPSPASASGSNSHASSVRTGPPSQNSSRGPSRPGSRGPSRRSSRENMASTIDESSSPPGPSTGSATTSSAFSPLFPFPSATPSSPSSTRSRAKSVYASPSGLFVPSSLPSTSFMTGQHPDSGVSPLTLGLSPLAEASASDERHGAGIRRISSQRQPGSGSGSLSMHRTSIAPGGNLLPHSQRLSDRRGENTSEYAQIILASRNAKMRKWKSSVGSFSPGHERASSWTGEGGVPASPSTTGLRRQPGEKLQDTDAGSDAPESADGVGFGLGVGSKEFEWVDWLDEYRKMKEAKLRAELDSAAASASPATKSDLTTDAGSAEESRSRARRISDEKKSYLASTSTSTATSPSVGKGKSTTEYNPFEATTSTRNFGPGAEFLTPDMPSTTAHAQYFPMTASVSPMSTSQYPSKTTPAPISGAETLSRTVSRQSANAVSPGVKRRRNFNRLGHKIDAWWSAVRSSFSLTPEEERYQRARRNSIDNSLNSLAPIVSRTSSTFTRPQPPVRPSLRNVSSAQDLSRPSTANADKGEEQSKAEMPPPPVPSGRASTMQSVPSRVVPTGALAPGARIVSTNRLQPPKMPGRHSSGSASDSDGGGTARSESRKRNPGLSLNLGPSFSTMSNLKRSQTAPAPAPVPAAIEKHSPEKERGKGPIRTHSMATPGISPMWDQTPGIVPTSTQFPLNSVPAVQSIQDNRDSKTTPSFSMHTVRHQIRLRLVSAKESCDKELRKIIQGISSHVESELHKDISTPAPGGAAFDDGRFGDLSTDETLFGSYGGQHTYDLDSESEALADVDDAPEEAIATDSDGATSRPNSRTKSSPLLGPDSSALSTRRPSEGAATGRRSPRRSSLAPRKRHLTSVPRAPDFSGYSLRQSRNQSTAGSAQSSRSNSRSRSPMPPLQLRNVSNGSRSPAQSSTPNPTTSSLAQSAFIVLLQEIITVATEILDTPVTKLTAEPGSCAEFINRVQQIGKAWDDNPELPCRGWYVQLLLAVAGLSRVLEWWDAEKGFWSFEDADDEDAEPLLFVSKPMRAEPSPELRARGDSQSSVAPSTSLPLPSKWSPLGIDLGEPAEDGGRPPLTQQLSDTDLDSTTADATAEETAEHADALKQTVEEIRSSTLLMELTLDGQVFQFLSSAWEDLVGLEPSECISLPISDFIYPDDAAVFAEATRQLEADDSHTVEVSFRLRVSSSSQTSNDDEPPEDLYEAMEGKGMLMLDGMTGRPSHTMWVVRPAPLADEEHAEERTGALARYGLDARHRRKTSDSAADFSANMHLSAEPVLCRICERATPVWFFEKHSETCNETHRLEGDISECNDRLKDLSRVVDDIANAIDDENLDEPEYRGITLTTSPPGAASPSAAAGMSPRVQSEEVKKDQHHILDLVHDILQTAIAISTPSVSDETGDIPIQEQRLLSPNSESGLAVVMRWQRPSVDDAALARLIADADEQIRFKFNSVNRLRNTILYAEKVRQEWEQKANEAMANQTSDWSASAAPFDSPALHPVPNSEDSPRLLDNLDLPRPGQDLRRHSSNLLGVVSPTLSSVDDTVYSNVGSPPNASMIMSPRIPSGVPSSRTKGSSIKDFKILKPISKGAFGSVFLAKKITTGDYYAIKVLKKSDMVAKNQVTNVKAERMILMTQTESDFVVKLYYTFQSKDYLYLVMEYLNGGDCASLVKNLGELPEEWARRYIAEVIVGLEYLHASGIVHRDLKPDNLLIDAKGHLKLTDFGLSRIGLLGRQTQMPLLGDTRGRRQSDRSVKEPERSNAASPISTPAHALGQSPASYFGNLPVDNFSLDTPSSESAASSQPQTNRQLNAAVEALAAQRREEPSRPLAPPSDTPPLRNFVGTPDYLAPESILGVGTDACVDWWALGVICYEFLYGIPPFHDETPEKVFENILSRRLDWHEDVIEIAPEAHDFIDRLLCTDPKKRLGAKGASEVKAHPFMAGIDWDHLLEGEVDFVPKVTDPENTDYFDARGATDQIFADDEMPGEELKIAAAPTPAHPQTSNPFNRLKSLSPSVSTTSSSRRSRRERSETAPSPQDDFGAFTFRNLTVLKQANDDVIRKMRDEQILPPASLDSPLTHPRQTALAGKGHKPKTSSSDLKAPSSPSSPSNSSSSSVPTRQTGFPSSSSFGDAHSRRASELPQQIERFRSRQPSSSKDTTGFRHSRRNSMPSRIRSKSVSQDDRPAGPDNWQRHERHRTSTQNSSTLSSPIEAHEPLPPLSIPMTGTPSSSSLSNSLDPQQAFSAPTTAGPIASGLAAAAARLSTIDVLVAGRNPIVVKVLETMLVRLGCRCITVPDGGEAILAAQGVHFDLIFVDLSMPVYDGPTCARMIKSTNNPSATSPIVAVCSHSSALDDSAGTLFDGILSKPIMKADLLRVFSSLGFLLERKDRGRRGSADAASTLDAESRRGSK